MTIPISALARTLNLHPANAFLYLRSFGLSFEQSWPTSDESLIETIRSLNPSGFRRDTSPTATSEIAQASQLTSSSPLSNEALHILDKLERGKHWAHNKIPRDKIKNHFCRDLPTIDPYLSELSASELILEPDSDTYSLNKAKKALIDEILDRYRVISRGNPR